MTIFDWFSHVLSTTSQVGTDSEWHSLHDEIMFGGEDFSLDDDPAAAPRTLRNAQADGLYTSPSFSRDLGQRVDPDDEAWELLLPDLQD